MFIGNYKSMHISYIIFLFFIVPLAYQGISEGVNNKSYDEEGEQIQESKDNEPQQMPYFTVWIGSSKDLFKAELEKDLYSEYEQPVHVVTIHLKDKGLWHRTYIGNFATKKEAEEFGNHLKKSLVIEWFQIIRLKQHEKSFPTVPEE